MPLSKFKHIFGKPGKGAHSVRFLGTALIDYVLTINCHYNNINN